jgi:hypothetical protein
VRYAILLASAGLLARVAGGIGIACVVAFGIIVTVWLFRFNYELDTLRDELRVQGEQLRQLAQDASG